MILTRIASHWINPVFLLLILNRRRWTLGKAVIAENAGVRDEIGHDAVQGFQKIRGQELDPNDLSPFGVSVILRTTKR